MELRLPMAGSLLPPSSSKKSSSFEGVGFFWGAFFLGGLSISSKSKSSSQVGGGMGSVVQLWKYSITKLFNNLPPEIYYRNDDF